MRLRTLPPARARSLWGSVRRHGFTLAALARQAAISFGDRPALTLPGAASSERGAEDWSVTYRELWDAAEGAAAVLYLGPLERRARTVVIACEGPALPIATLAASRLGLDLLLASREAGADELADVAPRDALLIREDDAAPPAWHRGPSATASEVLEWSRADGSGLGGTSRRSRIVLASITANGTPTTHVVGTMGVTGLRQLAGLHGRIGITSTDVLLSGSPMHRGHGLQLFGASLLSGAPLVSAPRADAATHLDLIERRFVSVLSATRSQLTAMLDALDASGLSAPPLRRIMPADETLDAALVQRLQRAWGPVVLNAFGTLDTGTVAVATPSVLAEEPGTAGTALPGTEFGIVGHAGRGDASGRLWVRGAHATVITDTRATIRDHRLTVDGPIVERRELL